MLRSAESALIIKLLITLRNFSPRQISDVVLKDSDAEKTRGVGARNERHLVGVHCGVRGAVEVVQGLLDNVMTACGIPFSEYVRKGHYTLQGEHGT